MIRFIAIVFCIIGLTILISNMGKTKLSNGVEYASSMPTQIMLDKDEQKIVNFYKDSAYKITKVASYDIKAKILSKKKYKNMGDEISPVDYALGWGKLSDEFYASHDGIKFSQSHRWYRYRYEESYPLDMGYIGSHSANTHIIPADEYVWHKSLDVPEGAVVHLTGYLVRVNKSDGWSWNSSLTREDTGDKSCEVFYVETLNVIAD